MTQPTYEFTGEQDSMLKSLARSMKYAGLLFIFFGIIIGVFCALTIKQYPFYGLAFLFPTLLLATIGVWTNFASYAFRQIVETAGSDMDHLMDALHNLWRLYWLQTIWLAIAVCLTLAVLILSFVLGYHVMVK
jgi:ABC-type multidrug transport system permease subunit